VVVGEQGHGEAELVAVEGAVRFPDDDGGEAALGVAQSGEQSAGLGAALPGQRTALADVEELGDDRATVRGDQVVRQRELPEF
jgi:hypothetical protein